MTVWHKTAEYKLIYEHYRDRTAERSGVPLINHIKEGIALLQAWERPDVEIRAFCLHPIVQNNLLIAPELFPDSYPLAVEYAEKANAYLCVDETAHIREARHLAAHLGNISAPVAWMLLADKVQNQKDFRIYHWFTHDKRFRLERYFNLWIDTLRCFYLDRI